MKDTWPVTSRAPGKGIQLNNGGNADQQWWNRRQPSPRVKGLCLAEYASSELRADDETMKVS